MNEVRKFTFSSVLFSESAEGEWCLRLALLRSKPSTALPENLVLLNSKYVAGPRHCIAAALTAIRELSTYDQKDDAQENSFNEKKAKITELNPNVSFIGAMTKKRSPHATDIFTELSESDSVLAIRLERLASEEGDSKFREDIAKLATQIIPFPQINEVKRDFLEIFDLSEKELQDLDKSVASRIAARDFI